MAPQGLTPRSVVVTGPTASGKTELALRLARALGGEIVSCDSRQVYRDISAGTDKPRGIWTRVTELAIGASEDVESCELRVASYDPARDPSATRNAVYLVEGIPYHLVDFLGVTETFSAGEFDRRGGALLRDIAARGKTPVLAGGTGLYLRALLHGLDPMPPRDGRIRARLQAEAESAGRAALHARLRGVDPAAAERIPANNLQRVVRALEVWELTGKPISSFWKRLSPAPLTPAPLPLRGEGKNEKGTAPLVVGLRWEKSLLEERIRSRAAAAFPRMIEEVRALRARGVAEGAPGLQTLGYPEALACAERRLSEAEGLSRYVRAVIQYAKRQRTWFRREPVRWIDARPGDDPAAWTRQVLEWREPWNA